MFCKKKGGQAEEKMGTETGKMPNTGSVEAEVGVN